MFAHLRANLWLLFLTVVICCVIYPAAVWVVAQTVFHNQAQGSLINAKGEPVSDPKEAVGSRLIAQQFNSAWYFQPRPSAASYNAAASGGSNYGASNPKLRGRVAQLLGTISRYSDAYKKAHPKPDGGEPNPQDDIVAWYKEQINPTQKGKEKRDLFSEWATAYSSMAGGWATGTDPIKDYINQWAKDHPDVVKNWQEANKDSTKTPGPDDLAPFFFQDFGKQFFGKWPTAEAPGDVKTKLAAWAKDHPNVVTKWKEANPDAKDDPSPDDLLTFFYADYDKNPKDWPPLEPGEMVDGAKTAVVKPDAQDSDVQATFFEMWLTERVKIKELDPLKDFDQVPADMVTASGSGLDPDISLRNAKYQSDSVVAANVKKIADAFDADDANKKAARTATDAQKKQLEGEVRKAVDDLLAQQAYRPMLGLTGDELLVNVLQLNVALKAKTDAMSIK